MENADQSNENVNQFVQNEKDSISIIRKSFVII